MCWYAAVADATLLTVIAVEHITRQLLPLAALLNLSLLFPDQAPRRFAVARRVGRPRDLQRQLQQARAAHGQTADVTYMHTILELIAALSVYDRRTRGHVDRVRVFTEMIATEMHLPAADRARLRWAAMLHDIGKLLVPTEVLNKQGALNPHEWEVIRRHPEEGARLIDPLRPWLGLWALTVEHHHERWDGGGYPRGLAGEQISLGGRIVAVADAFETMTTARPYQRPMSVTAARAELVHCAGSQFDPTVVRALLNVSMGRCWRAVGLASLVAQVPLISPISNVLSQLGTLAPSAVATGLAALPLVLATSAPVQFGAYGNSLTSPARLAAAATLPAAPADQSRASSPSPQPRTVDPTATPTLAPSPSSASASPHPASTPPSAPTGQAVMGIRLTSIHLTGTSGSVQLSWAVGASPTGYAVLRASAANGPFDVIASLGAGATGYVDTTASYDSQYYYEVESADAGGGGGANAKVDPALSLPPTGGIDDATGAGGSTFSAGDLAAVSTPGGASYTSGQWAGGDAQVMGNPGNGKQTGNSPISQYMQWSFSPSIAPGAAVTSAKLTLTVSANAAPDATTLAYLLVSTNDGASWTVISIATPETWLTTQVVDLGAVIRNATEVQRLQIRYALAGSTGLQTSFDLVHLDIN
jgi:HD-GYP domain-containing protein (c-di-GMP phosphodiesterase class II)